MQRHSLSAAVALLLSALSGVLIDAHADDIRRPYIVQLADKPLSSYTGGVNNIPATRPAKGLRLDLHSAAAQSYSRALVQKQQSVKSIIPAAPILYDYKVVLNGFAAMLTDAEVRALKANAGVASISADTPHYPVTSYTPTFLGLDGPGGLWQQLGGKDKAGEDVVIGVIDSGVWPENPSFADRVDSHGKPTFDNSGTLVYNPPVGWQGACETGEGFTVAHCNNKLIGARYFIDGFRASEYEMHWSEFVSPRDSVGGTVGRGGHGTHTATTAAGNSGVTATLGDNVGLGATSGMAPRARIAAYKVCWTFPDRYAPAGINGCWGTDSAAAIEQAVIDGVDVLNFSISGGSSLEDPVEQAFLHAANAGVFVAAAGGNDGPVNSVNHNSPWLTTVAASSHARLLRATVTLGNGASYVGASLNNHALPAGTPIVRSIDVHAAAAGTDAASKCYSSLAPGGPGLDPAKVAGKIVTCLRGDNDRIDKSLAVKQAGGVGMILIDDGNGLVAEVHSVPTVHVSAADGVAIQAYAANAATAPKAALGVFRTETGTGAPVMAAFSSRGPNQIDTDQLKPDLTAPGVEILAGVTPGLTPEQRADIVNGTARPAPAWAFYQGTSMATPHVAGVAALLRQQHPGWSPAAIKSALMTSATPTFKDSQGGDMRGTLPWGQGAGHINLTGSMAHPADGKAYNRGGASDPGLVYELGPIDYKRYLCGAGVAAECGDGALAGYNLNLPSITLGSVAGTVEVKRTVTNVGATEATYKGSIALPGYSAVLSPTSLTLAPGASASYTVKVARTTAPNTEWQFGEVTWTDSAHVVRIPLTARNVQQVSAPELAASTRASSTVLLTVLPAFTGRLGAVAAGFKEVTVGPVETVGKVQSVVDGPGASTAACVANAPGVKLIPVTIPADTVAAVFETFDRDTGSGGTDDVDMVVLDPRGAMAGVSLRGYSNEQVVLRSPAAGTYNVCVIGYAPADGVSTQFRLSSAIVTRGDTLGNLKVAAGRVTAGTVATLTASWSGLPAGKRYFGGVQFLDAAGLIATSTALQVETNDPVPLARGSSHATRVIGTK